MNSVCTIQPSSRRLKDGGGGGDVSSVSTRYSTRHMKLRFQVLSQGSRLIYSRQPDFRAQWRQGIREGIEQI